MKFKAWRSVTGNIRPRCESERELQDRFDRVFNELLRVVPKDKRRLLNELENVTANVITTQANDQYLEGLESGRQKFVDCTGALILYMARCRDKMDAEREFVKALWKA